MFENLSRYEESIALLRVGLRHAISGIGGAVTLHSIKFDSWPDFAVGVGFICLGLLSALYDFARGRRKRS